MINDGFTPNPSEADINELFQELIAHGTPLFGLSVHKTINDQTRNIMIHKHWHKELEILYIQENDLLIEIGNQSFQAKQGDILFIPSNQLHSAYQFDQQGAVFYAIVFDLSFISSFGSDNIQQRYLEPLNLHPEHYIHHFSTTNDDYLTVKKIIIEIIDLFSLREKGFELLIKSSLYQFIFYLLQDTDENIDKNISQREALTALRIKNILTFIENNYQLTISLDTIAESVNLSKQYFCRFFKKNFHISFNTYLMQYRLNRAELLLMHTDLSIIEIALMVGFESANYFTIAFKKNRGYTPSDFRKKATNSQESRLV